MLLDGGAVKFVTEKIGTTSASDQRSATRMCEYAFPISDREQLVARLGIENGSMSAIDATPIRRRASTWQRFRFSTPDARVLIVLSTRWMLPHDIIVKVVWDHSRFFRFSTWKPDARLRRRICGRMKELDGLYIGDGLG